MNLAYQRLTLVLSFLLAFPAYAMAPKEPSAEGNEQRLLANTRQLIFAGRRSGEGYFSRDGKQMIFQSERDPANPFYQIFLMDTETGDTTRVSPGVGKTTCAWIHPTGKKVLFASTHEDPDAEAKQRDELDKRAKGQGSRYSWSFDEHYDIFAADASGTLLDKLTTARGYDAEASWSPDGSKILFASNRRAYSEKLSAEEQKYFTNDKSYFMDIYMLDADGGNLKRLTSTPGYDGGPFFSADGKYITWRLFTPDGTKAEIWIMDSDGSNQRQITRLNAMSWAPYFHPSGDYLIFATNVHGFGNFELYLVAADGRSEPVRVTETKGFDGLPVFTPDGRKLAWSSQRTANRQAQIFLANWNDAAARELLGLNRTGPTKTESKTTTVSPVAEFAATTSDITAADLRKHLTRLASEALGGRLTGTDGERAAADYVASAFAYLGLQPAGDIGDWFQRFEFTQGVSLDAGNQLRVETSAGTQELKVDKDWRPLNFSQIGSVALADVVFAGYGIIAPEGEQFSAYDSYKELDVEGKWVVAFRYLPENISPEYRQYLNDFAHMRYKAIAARDKGAVGLILVSGPNANVRDQLIALSSKETAAGTSIAVLSVTDAAAESLLTGSAKKLSDLQTALDNGDKKPGFVLSDVRVDADIRLQQEQRFGRNVLARLIVGDKPSESVVIIGAHLDHIGSGTGLDSRASGGDVGRVHPGADDNASGISGLLEIAQQLTAQQRQGKLKAVRDILFAAWSGEELGRLGSARFIDVFRKNGASTAGLSPEVVAYLNMDMIGRLDEHLFLQGVGSSSIWRGEIERRNVPVGLSIKTRQDSYLPTDAMSFYLQGVPILSAFTGNHPDYNTPNDTADRINYEGTAKITRLMALLARAVAMRADAPDYIETEKPDTNASRANLRAYLGTIPDYAEGDIVGVKINGVAKGGPAFKAGLKKGDIILEVGGRKIENIYDYTYALNALKVGQPVKIMVARNNGHKDFSVVPSYRE